MVGLLLERGAGVNVQSRNGLTALHLAAQDDRTTIARMLTRYGANIDPQTKVSNFLPRDAMLARYRPMLLPCEDADKISADIRTASRGLSATTDTNLYYTNMVHSIDPSLLSSDIRLEVKGLSTPICYFVDATKSRATNVDTSACYNLSLIHI